MSAAPASSGDPVLITYWEVIWKHRLMVVVIWLAVATAAVIAAFVLPKVYRAEAVLAVQQAESRPASGIASLVGDIAPPGLGAFGSSSIRQAVAQLKSRAITYKFIRQYNLIPALFPERLDGSIGRWRTDDGAGREPTLWEAYERFDRHIRKISVDYEANLLRLSIEHTDPEVAARWATDLVSLANHELQKRAIAEGEKQIEYLLRKIEEASLLEVRQSLLRLVERQLNSNMVAAGTDDYAFRVIDPAVPPEEFFSPNRLLIIVVGVLAGLISAALVALVYEGILRYNQKWHSS